MSDEDAEDNNFKAELFLPRSTLFVPADNDKLISKAVHIEADAICLDVEDGVSASAKKTARAALEGAGSALKAGELSSRLLMVRVNSEPDMLEQDLASLPAQCDFVMLPKAEGLDHVQLVGEALDQISKAGGANAKIIALVEDARGLLNFRNAVSDQTGLKPHSRLAALALGTEDFSNDLNCRPDARIMETVLHELCLVARALDLAVVGTPATIAEFKDLDAYETGALKGMDAGTVGGLCIHPAQVEILNKVFSPTKAQLSWAHKVVEAFELAEQQGEGVTTVDERMVDRPVYLQALQILRRNNSS